MADGTPSILETRVQVPQDPALINDVRRKILQDMKDWRLAEAIEKALMGDDSAYRSALQGIGLAYEDPASCQMALRAMGVSAKEELEERAAAPGVKAEVKDEDLQKDETLQMLLGLQDCKCLRAFPCRLKSGHTLDVSED